MWKHDSVVTEKHENKRWKCDYEQRILKWHIEHKTIRSTTNRSFLLEIDVRNRNARKQTKCDVLMVCMVTGKVVLLECTSPEHYVRLLNIMYVSWTFGWWNE